MAFLDGGNQSFEHDKTQRRPFQHHVRKCHISSVAVAFKGGFYVTERKSLVPIPGVAIKGRGAETSRRQKSLPQFFPLSFFTHP